MKYYVYLHKRKDNGVVFYVGKGCGNRYKTTRRNKKWLTIKNEAGGYIPEIIENNLTEEDALLVEENLLKNPNPDWKLINKFRNTSNLVIDFSEISEYVEYDPNSVTGLVWKKWNRSKIKKTSRVAGDVAGYMTNDSTGKQYYTVRICGKSLLVHRIIWTMLKGEIPKGYVVNHINSNGLDNTIENLTCITQRHNSQQTTKQLKPNVGITELVVRDHMYAVASWTEVDGKKRNKLFPYAVYGKDKALSLAAEYRKLALLSLNKDGAGYLILQN